MRILWQEKERERERESEGERRMKLNEFCGKTSTNREARVFF